MCVESLTIVRARITRRSPKPRRGAPLPGTGYGLSKEVVGISVLEPLLDVLDNRIERGTGVIDTRQRQLPGTGEPARQLLVKIEPRLLPNRHWKEVVALNIELSALNVGKPAETAELVQSRAHQLPVALLIAHAAQGSEPAGLDRGGQFK